MRSFPREGTQRRIILDRLIAAHGEPVGLNELMFIAHCGATHSQISKLREYGWTIHNRTKPIKVDGLTVNHSVYWLPVDQLTDVAA